MIQEYSPLLKTVSVVPKSWSIWETFVNHGATYDRVFFCANWWIYLCLFLLPEQGFQIKLVCQRNSEQNSMGQYYTNTHSVCTGEPWILHTAAKSSLQCFELARYH